MFYFEKFSEINDVGVELEGGISEKALTLFKEKAIRDGFFKKLSIGYDGSVNVPEPFGTYDWINNIEIRFWSNDIDELLHYVDVLFSLGFRQNQTCGNHHHFTFTSRLSFTTAASFSFYREFIRKYKAFAIKSGEKYVKRLHNSYCRAPSNDVDLYNSIVARDRYFAINFCSIFKHFTLEVRILPYADDSREFEKMHIWLCKTLNSLIRKYKQRTITAEVRW
ncbi:MAG: hypothetical protein QXS69_04030 [Candidatus Aenigmatarchaeota archaeon]